MEVSTATLTRFDLTGRVIVTNLKPVFVGNYSDVYKGTLDGNIVAVKVIKVSGEPHSMQRKLVRERLIWASLDHKNIHPFYGFANDEDFAPFGALVSPWCTQGDASKFLKEYGSQMPEGERIKLWSGVVEGVTYLHLHNPVVVHGDLKPGNVLIDGSGRPRICDYGLSRLFLDEEGTSLTTTSEHTGTERYLAPELVMSENTVYPTTESDVYALGCLGLELIYLRKPYSHRKNNLRGQIIIDLRTGIPPATDPPEPWSQVWALLRSCWNKEPDLRPSAIVVTRDVYSAVNQLPSNVVEMIIGFVADEKLHDDGDWRVGRAEMWHKRNRTLSWLCLVCRAWRVIATPHMYRDVRIWANTDESIARLDMLARSLASPTTVLEVERYGHIVQSITLDIGPVGHNAPIGDTQMVSYALAVLIATTRWKPALNSLEVIQIRGKDSYAPYVPYLYFNSSVAVYLYGVNPIVV